jgi:Holliday junction resolvase-like predicted endonuclease
LRVLGRDVRTPFAQVDLVLRDGNRLVCAEVKSALVDALADAPRGAFRPGRRCDRRRLARQERAARWLARGAGARARIDLIEVWLERGTGRWRALHHRDLDAPIELRS